MRTQVSREFMRQRLLSLLLFFSLEGLHTFIFVVYVSMKPMASMIGYNLMRGEVNGSL